MLLSFKAGEQRPHVTNPKQSMVPCLVPFSGRHHDGNLSQSCHTLSFCHCSDYEYLENWKD